MAFLFKITARCLRCDMPIMAASWEHVHIGEAGEALLARFDCHGSTEVHGWPVSQLTADRVFDAVIGEPDTQPPPEPDPQLPLDSPPPPEGG